MSKIFKIFERECMSNMCRELYNNSLNEGHTLLNHIDKIINVYNIVNERLKNSTPIDDREFKITIKSSNHKPYTLIGMKYAINISFSELGVDDIIKSKNHNLKLNIFNVDNYEYLPQEIWNGIAGGHVIHIGDDRVENDVYIQDDNHLFDKMKIDCYALDGDIEPIGFYSVFLHEFNHYVEGYNRVKKNSLNGLIDNIRKINSVKKSIQEDKAFFTEKDKDCLNDILYRLWQGGEKNSLIGNLFGELLARNVKDETELGNLSKEYKLFYKYEELKNKLQHIESNIDAVDLYDFFFVANVYDFILGKKSTLMTPNKFKKYFIDHSKDLLKKMYKKGIKFIGDYLKVVSNFENKHITKYTYER